MPYQRRQTGSGGAVSQSYSTAPFHNNEGIPSTPYGTPNAATQGPYIRSEPHSLSSIGAEFGCGPETKPPPGSSKWEYDSLFTNSPSDVQPSLAQSISPPESTIASPAYQQALPQYDIKYELGSPMSIDATLDYAVDLLPPADFPSEANSTTGAQGKPLERKEIEARAREKMRRSAQKLRIALIPHLNSGHGLRGNADVMEYAALVIQRQNQNVNQLRNDLSNVVQELNRLRQSSSCGF